MRKQSERAWHNIRPNETTRIPRKHIFLDTESRSARRGKVGVQTWRLASAHFYEAPKSRRAKSELRDYRDPRQLWRDVSDFVGADGRTILWAHNLGHDARISTMLETLPGMGFSLTGHNITPRSTWLEWRKGKATLLCVDSVTVFNTTIEQMGTWHGIGKPDIDLDSDNDDDWFRRCRADVTILSHSVRAYLEWLESADMGNWQITGPAQSWATYRHKFLTCKLTVHDDKDALAMERRAMWTGRCEAYWHGKFDQERVFEWDFKQDYPRIARDHLLPIKLIGPIPPHYGIRDMQRMKTTALLAHVVIQTDVPVVPASRNGRILWPTGRFETVLWDVEIQAALDAGASVEIVSGYLYRKGPALKVWGEWIIGELAKSDSEVPAWQKAILKHWSRALIGRFAMTYNQWEEWGESPAVGTMRGYMIDSTTDTRTEIMQVGTTVWQDKGRVEWQNSMPMITGYVQAIGRVHLWDIMSQLPGHSFIYVDTDSILCTEKHMGAIAEVARNYRKGELRLKRAWDGFAIYGPRQVVTGNQVRISGVSRTAERVSDRTFRGEVWDSLIGSIRGGLTDRVVVRERLWKVAGVDPRRDGNGFGWTRPIHIEQEGSAVFRARPESHNAFTGTQPAGPKTESARLSFTKTRGQAGSGKDG